MHWIFKKIFWFICLFSKQLYYNSVSSLISDHSEIILPRRHTHSLLLRPMKSIQSNTFTAEVGTKKKRIALVMCPNCIATDSVQSIQSEPHHRHCDDGSQGRSRDRVRGGHVPRSSRMCPLCPPHFTPKFSANFDNTPPPPPQKKSRQ